VPISRFPSTERDICFKVADNVTYANLLGAVKKSLESVQLETGVTPVDIYQSDDKTTKNITLRVKLVSHDRTLTGDEVSGVIKSVTESVIGQTGAEVV
jgi:phenylalanyl-tRNA synthetase beta subunit